MGEILRQNRNITRDLTITFKNKFKIHVKLLLSLILGVPGHWRILSRSNELLFWYVLYIVKFVNGHQG